jgi:hypothetical protein
MVIRENGRKNNSSRFFCVGVMYSGEYDACDVTLSVYPHRIYTHDVTLSVYPHRIYTDVTLSVYPDIHSQC